MAQGFDGLRTWLIAGSLSSTNRCFKISVILGGQVQLPLLVPGGQNQGQWETAAEEALRSPIIRAGAAPEGEGFLLLKALSDH